ncbi:MAG: hypothetical protein AAB412_03970 [Elusimicrobiota bacterium]
MQTFKRLFTLILASGLAAEPGLLSAQSVPLPQSGQFLGGSGTAVSGAALTRGQGLSQGPSSLTLSISAGMLPSLSGGSLTQASYSQGPVAAQAQAHSLSLAPVSPAGVSRAAQSRVQNAPAGLAAPVLTASDRSAAPAFAKEALPLSEGPAALRAAPDQAAAPRTLQERLAPLSKAVSDIGSGISVLSGSDARSAAERQIGLLTGEKSFSPAAPEDAAPTPSREVLLPGSRLDRAEEGPAPVQADTPPAPAPSESETEAAAPKAPGSWLSRLWSGVKAKAKVFEDPERNKSFWRYAAGYMTYLVGMEMYIVGLPFLISAFTKNTLRDNGDLRAGNEEALKALIRENRSMARIAHWVAQAFAYATVPLFTQHGQESPKKWLVRTAFIRAAILTLIPTVFFLSGVFSLQAALWTLFGLIAVHSFFQGIFVTMDGGSQARIIGDKSVTPGERMKANAILTFASAVIAIIAPAIAGYISQVGDLFGKTGSGGAIIYGIYAGAMALGGLLFASVGIIGDKLRGKAPEQDADQPRAPPQAKEGVLKGLWTSLKEGVVFISKNRFLRTMTALNLIISLFSDPLIFNILPEYMETVLQSNPATIGGLLGVPGLGWLLKGLTSTPMGYFGLLVASASLGSVLATLLIEPLKNLFKKLGFKTEESLTIPFYILAALEVPLFWTMIYFPSFWGVLGLYGLQALATSFSSMLLTGLYQKSVGGLDSKKMNQVLAAESFLGILAAIVATYFYGFVLTGIPIATSLLIAAVATTVLGALRLASPWLFFSKAERKGEETPAPKP